MGVLIIVIVALTMLLLHLSRAFQGYLSTSSTGTSLRSSRHRSLSFLPIDVLNSMAMAATVSTHTNDQPTSDKDNLKGYVARGASSLIIPLVATLGLSNPLSAYASNGPMAASSQTKQQQADPQEQGPATRAKDSLDRYLETLPLGKDAYTTLGGGDSPLITCKVLNGMWQVSGAHGFNPVAESAIEKMTYCADEGFTTFDLADHYGPAEDYVGRFCVGPLASPVSKQCQFFTKWVPRPDVMTRRKTEEAISTSLRRMKTDRIDLLQFHWWDYDNKNYLDAMDQLMGLQQDDRIRSIGLTNFDTKHLSELLEEGAPIVSNQVSFSVLDTRPLKYMSSVADKHQVKLLCYGSLLGGFLSSYWLKRREPSEEDPELRNVSLRKYLRWIQVWGGWELFQELLAVLDGIAVKHRVSLSNVAQRWVLDQQAVGGIIVGVRLGYRDHVKDNRRVFEFQLDDDDRSAIAEVQGKRKRDLMTVYGDCGGEYRSRRG